MSEASGGRAAGEVPATCTVQLTWQCTVSSCRMELKGIPPNSLPFCPFCKTSQEGFSHLALGDVSEPRANSPQSTAAQEEHSEVLEFRVLESSDVNPMDASSSSKLSNRVEINTVGGEASSWPGNDSSETPPPSKCPKLDGARDHHDSTELGSEAVSSTELPLTDFASTPSSPSTELIPPCLPLTLPRGSSPDDPPGGPPLPHPPDGTPLPPGTPLLPGGPLPSQTGPHLPHTSPPLPQAEPSPSQMGPSPTQMGPLLPHTGQSPPKPEPRKLTETTEPMAGAHPLSDKELEGSPQDSIQASKNDNSPQNPLSDALSATSSVPTRKSQQSPPSHKKDSDLPPGKRRKVVNPQPVVGSGHSTPPPKDKGGQNSTGGVGAGEPGTSNRASLEQPEKQTSSLLGRRPLRNNLSGTTGVSTQTTDSTDEEGRSETVEIEASQHRTGAGKGPPAANTRSQTVTEGQVSSAIYSPPHAVMLLYHNYTDRKVYSSPQGMRTYIQWVDVHVPPVINQKNKHVYMYKVMVLSWRLTAEVQLVSKRQRR